MRAGRYRWVEVWRTCMEVRLLCVKCVWVLFLWVLACVRACMCMRVRSVHAHACVCVGCVCTHARA